MRVINNFLTNIKHIPGWSTNRKLLLIESDDWGSTRMPNLSVRETLSEKGILGTNKFMAYDTLASRADLEDLFDALRTVKDKNGNHAVFCPFVNVTNADFQRIIDSNYEEYFYEPFTTTLSKYYQEDVFGKWKDGIAERIFLPEYHGREHFNVPLLMKHLKLGTPELIAVFKLGVIHIPISGFKSNSVKSLAPTYYYENQTDKAFLEQTLIEGASIFEQLFGYAPTCFNPPNGVFSSEMEIAVSKTKIKTIVVIRKRPEPDGTGNVITRDYQFKFGKKNKFGNTYYRRNCKFEPVQKEYSRSKTVYEILSAIKMRKPAIISTHRINFVGSIDSTIKEFALDELRAILKEVVRVHPDIEFISSQQLSSLIGVMEKKLVLGITSPGSVPLIRGQAKYFGSLGYKVFLMCPKDERSLNYCEEEGCELIAVGIDRYINVFSDIVTLVRIVAALSKIKPDIINVGTPKMGLLGSIAGYLLGVKKRVYTCRGFRYEHEKGLKRKVLQLTDKISGALSDTVICIAPSLREKALNDNIFSENKIIVINKGSSNGINLSKYNPSVIPQEHVVAFKQQYNLTNCFVFGFVGRLVDRKGINELYSAFSKLASIHGNIKLLVVGNPDFNQLADKDIVKKYNEHKDIVCVGWQNNIPLVMKALDVFVMPAWWEGFGNSYLEAAAMGIPVIGTDVTGAKDAVNNGFNGLVIPCKDTGALIHAMEFYYNNPDTLASHGNNGRIWVNNFKQQIIWEGLNEVYS